jgi:hypothetical protein
MAPLVDGRGTDVRVSQYILSSSWQLVNILLIGYRFRIRGVSNGGGEVEIQFAEQKNWRSPQVHAIAEEKAPRFQSETWATREMTYYERNLPHWHPAGKSIFVTWRLFGSLPRTVGARIKSSGNAPGKRFLVFDECLDSAKCGPLWLLESVCGFG